VALGDNQMVLSGETHPLSSAGGGGMVS